MSFKEHQNRFKGFYKTYWAGREDFYYNMRLSPAKEPFQRFAGRHKNIRYMGERYKQFDIKPLRIVKNLKSHKCIPHGYEYQNIIWRFGRKNGMHLHNKIRY